MLRRLHQLHQRRRQGRKLVGHIRIGLVDVFHQGRIAHQRTDPLPYRLRALQRRLQVFNGLPATPRFRLVRLRHALIQPPHGGAQFFLQHIHPGDLRAQNCRQAFIRRGVTLIGEVAQLRQHAARLIPQRQHRLGQRQLVAGNAGEQRAVAVMVLRQGDRLIKQHILKRRQPLHHHAGLLQLFTGQRIRLVQQRFRLANHHVAFVRPELNLPAAVAFG